MSFQLIDLVQIVFHLFSPRLKKRSKDNKHSFLTVEDGCVRNRPPLPSTRGHCLQSNPLMTLQAVPEAAHYFAGGNCQRKRNLGSRSLLIKGRHGFACHMERNMAQAQATRTCSVTSARLAQGVGRREYRICSWTSRYQKNQ